MDIAEGERGSRLGPTFFRDAWREGPAFESFALNFCKYFVKKLIKNSATRVDN